MSNEIKITPGEWAKKHGVDASRVVALLHENGVQVLTPFTPVPQMAFASIEAQVMEEKAKADARRAKASGLRKNLKKNSTEEKEGEAPAKPATPAATTGRRTITGKFMGGSVKVTRSATARPAVVKTVKPAVTPAVKPAAPKATPAAPVSPAPAVKPTPAPVQAPKPVAPQASAPAAPKAAPAAPAPVAKPQAPAAPKPATTVKAAPVGELRQVEMKAQVFKPDAAILARIEKSRQQQAAQHRFRGNNNGSGQGYTGHFGPGSNNGGNYRGGTGNGNNHYRGNDNGSSTGSRSFGGGQTRGQRFSGQNMQDVFANAQNNANGANNRFGNNNKQGQNRGGNNDRFSKNKYGGKNGRDSKDNRFEQSEQQDSIRQNVSRVMASLSKNPVKKVYHKDKAASNDGEQKKILKTSDFITVGELAGMMDQMPARVIAKCMEMGMMVTINARLDFETIQVLADEFGYEAQLMEEYEEEVLGVEEEKAEDLEPRHPVVTVMGHVDHGKTSLLDWIRKTHVVSGESGGITQHIGAYEVTTSVGKVTFLDTPGHEAFSAMRARGSQVTDVIVLVVAADSMVMPQTVESIELAHREKVPMVVAITKIDLPTANPDKIRAQLAERGVEVEQWGGNVSCIEVSARTGQGMPQLLETLALEAEVLELKASKSARARGAVVESKLDAGKGSMATVLIQNGTLHVGDPFVCGVYAGRVRAMFDDRGKQMKEAGPSAPCQVLGFDGTPQAGDELSVVEDEKTAREIASKRRMAARERDLRARSTISLESKFNEQKEGKLSELNLIVKADVGGSAEALAASLEKLTNREVKVNIIRKGVGAITDSDILFATTAQAIIISFHLMPSLSVREMAQKEGVEIRNYRVIY
ncbi:MAG: translation initiation factor IF-2, partial [Hallerella sp.]|nr:translation initiation factor IF-2 [Hallerella sp.]